MSIIRNYLQYSLVLIALVAFSCRHETIYVSPGGSDNRPGTRLLPVKSLQRALTLSREKGVKKIQLAEGDYYQVVVNISTADSGLVIAGKPGKRIRLHGGAFLKDWIRDGAYLRYNLHNLAVEKPDFRIIVVNDSLRERARIPEQGALTHRNVWSHKWQSSQGGWSKVPSYEDLTTLYYNQDDGIENVDIRNAELTVFHCWDDSYVGLKSRDTIRNSLTFAYPATHPPGSFADWGIEKCSQYIVWNTREGMHHPGQWYLDRSAQQLFYWPRNDENPENLAVVVPTGDYIFRMDSGVHNISLENLILSCSGAPLSNTGYGSTFIEGAVQILYGTQILLKNLNISNTAGWGIKLKGKNIRIEDCEISQTGAGGIVYNGEQISVERCGIHDQGKLYFGAVGIFGEGKGNLVSHCELYNLPYCAINGLGAHSKASYNLIYNFKQWMTDGGALYCYGGDSTVYSYNAVLAPPDNQIEGWTYYFDELSRHCRVEKNLALNTRVPVHLHMANNVTVSGNVFIDQGTQFIDYQLTSDLIFTDNLFYADTVCFRGPTGERMSIRKEDLNSVFQKFYEANGIVDFTSNKLYCRAALQEVQHMYTADRTETFGLAGNMGKAIAYDSLLASIRESPSFNQTGYRGRFKELLYQFGGK